MQSERADSGDPVGDGDSAAMYRVRFWTPPPAPHFAWLVDEWNVAGAEQVTDVIEWGTKKANGNPFEVFLRWEDYHLRRDGQPEPYARYVLVYGRPADVETTTETVVFESQ